MTTVVISAGGNERDPAQGREGEPVRRDRPGHGGSSCHYYAARRKQAVVLSFEDYEKLANVPSFGGLLASFPGDEADIPPRSARPSRSVVDF
jgi:hypothetical protein